MRKLHIVLIILATGAILAPIHSAYATYWGYKQETAVKQHSRAYVRALQTMGIDAKFKFYEDGSWVITGCVSDGLCQD